jgi:Flp pilus assembly protein TadD
LQPPREKRLVEAAYYRGQLHLERGAYAEALTDFDLVVAENPDFRPVYLLRARVRLLQGQAALCRKELDAFLANGQAVAPEVHGQRGRLLRLLLADLPPAGQRACALLALKELQEAAESEGRSPSVCNDLGAVLEHLGKMREAIRAYSDGLQQAPGDVKLRVQRGWACEREQQDEQAEADFREAARLDPGNAEAHTGLGYLQARGKKCAEAQRSAARALLHGAGDYLVLHNVACIYAVLAQTDNGRAAGHQDMAIALLRRAVELSRRGGAGPEEAELIKHEKAFDRSLRARPDFQKLIRGEGL